MLWRVFGDFVQVMDPGVGRGWRRRTPLLRDLYIHTATLPAEAWRGWVEGETFLAALRRRLRELGLTQQATQTLLATAQADAGWRTFAALDAATRLTSALVRSGGLRKGPAAAQVLKHFAETAANNDPTIIPENYWMVRPAKPDAHGTEQSKMRGAVLISAQ